MLLVALSLPDGLYLPSEQADDWYGISPDSADRGLRELRKAALLDADRQWVKNQRSDTGWTEHWTYPDRLILHISPAHRSRHQAEARARQQRGEMTTVPPGRALHVAAGIIPATLTVLFAGLIAFIALALDSGRRQYALDIADRFVDLAAVLVGLIRPRRSSVLQAAKPHREPLPPSTRASCSAPPTSLPRLARHQPS